LKSLPVLIDNPKNNNNQTYLTTTKQQLKREGIKMGSKQNYIMFKIVFKHGFN